MFETSPYVECFKECIRSSLTIHKALFSKEEKEVAAEMCLLDHDAILLFSRLTSRKRKWVRTNVLSKMYSRLTVHTEFALATSTATLLHRGYIESFDVSTHPQSMSMRSSSGLQNTSCDRVFDLMASCVSLIELKQVCTQMNVSCGPTVGVGAATRAQCLQGLWTKCTTQRSLFGQSLVARTSSILASVLRASDASRPHFPEETKPELSDRTEQQQQKQSHSQPVPAVPTVVRVTPTVLRLVRRIQRLFHAAGNCANWMGGGATSVEFPCGASTAQLVAFNKARFPATELDEDCELFSSVAAPPGVSGASDVAGSLQLDRHVRFWRWEAANELSCVYDECGANLAAWGPACVADLFCGSSGPGASALPVYADAELHQTVVALGRRVIALAALFDSADAAATAAARGALSEDDSGALATAATQGQPVEVVLLSDSEDESRAGGTELSTADVCVPSMVAKTLFEEHVQTGRLCMRTAVAIVAGICLKRYSAYCHGEGTSSACGSCVKTVPDYIAVLNAGTVLAAVLHREAFDVVTLTGVGGGADAAALPEWAALKDFMLSTELLRLLLSCQYDGVSSSGEGVQGRCRAVCRYTPHRRGRWYERLCINLERQVPSRRVDGETAVVDMALLHLVLQYLLNSICSDPHVELGDRLPLGKKLEKLCKNLGVARSATTSSASAQGCAESSPMSIEVVSHEFFELTCRSNLEGLVVSRYFHGGEYHVDQLLAGGTAAPPPAGVRDSLSMSTPAASVWPCPVCTFINSIPFTQTMTCSASASAPKRQRTAAINLACTMCGAVTTDPVIRAPIGGAPAASLQVTNGAGVINLTDDSDIESEMNNSASPGPLSNTPPPFPMQRIESTSRLRVCFDCGDGEEVGSSSDAGSSITNLNYLFAAPGFTADGADINRLICEYSPLIMQIYGVRFYLTDASAGSSGRVGSNSASGAGTGPRFICDNDEVVGVEQYILRILRHPQEYVRYMEGSGGGESKPRPRASTSTRATPKSTVPQEEGNCSGPEGEGAGETEGAVDVSRLFASSVVGGGWEGWHCEGGPLKSLFILLMWDVLYSPSSAHVPEADGGERRSVFISRYQVAPLDLFHPAQFVRARAELIAQRLTQIASWPRTQLVAEIGRTYRRHYRTSCVSGMNWNRDSGDSGGGFFNRRRAKETGNEWDSLTERSEHQPRGRRRGASEANSAADPVDAADPVRASTTARSSSMDAGHPPFDFNRSSSSLHSLQLIAACLGGVRAAAICKVFVSNYKYFSAGCPDLLLCRITRTPCQSSAVGPEDAVTATATATGAGATRATDVEALKADFVFERTEGCVGLEVLSLSFWLENQYRREKAAAALRAQLARVARDATRTDSTEGEGAGASGALSTVCDGDADADAILIDCEDSTLEAAEISDLEPANRHGGDDQVSSPHFNFRSDTGDLVLPEEVEGLQGGGDGYQYSYDIMFLEVKSPTDHLQHKQSIWLQLLNLYGVDAHICRVIER